MVFAPQTSTSFFTEARAIAQFLYLQHIESDSPLHHITFETIVHSSSTFLLPGPPTIICRATDCVYLALYQRPFVLLLLLCHCCLINSNKILQVVHFYCLWCQRSACSFPMCVAVKYSVKIYWRLHIGR